MKLSAGANFDIQLAPELAQCGVEEVFGKLPWDFTGGGRPTYMSTPVTWRTLEHYVAALAREGIAFNYLLNAACMSNREWSRPWQKKLLALLDRLGEIGICRLTISTPYLLETVRRRFPHFCLKAGLYAMIDSPGRARFWQDLGADVLTLECRTIQRDLERLGAIRQAVRCELQLIANHACLSGCPMLAYHQNGIAHSSDGSGGVFIDYCFLRCTRLKLQDPVNFIRAGWIRPEDVGVYERLGIDSLKILERGMASEDLLRRVRAYHDRRFDGNLAELILPHGSRNRPRVSRWWLRHFLKPRQIGLRHLRPFLELMRSQGMLFALERPLVQIDSAAIPEDFLAGFAGRRCDLGNCPSCDYCGKIAGQAVRLDRQRQDQALAQFQDLECAMAEGRPWNV